MLNMIKEIAKKHFKTQIKHEKNTQKEKHTYVKNLKDNLMTKDFLWRLKLHVDNYNWTE